MADGSAPTLAVTDAVLSSRSRSGSSSGSSESDGPQICKIIPLVAPVSSSPRPLTPKKRHRAEMEEEARKQEALRAAEQARAESRDKTHTADEKPREDKETTGKTIPELETETPAEAATTSLPTTPVKSKDTEIETMPEEKGDKRRSAKRRKAEAGAEEPVATETTPARRRTTPKKYEDAKTPLPSKSSTRAPRTPSTAVVTEAGDEPPLPEGWRRLVTQRMQGETAGKFDVYIWSPCGKKFRSRPQLIAFLEETGSSLSIENFSFKHSGAASTPAKLRKSSPAKEKKPTSPAKRKRKTSAAEKTTPGKGRPKKKNNVAKKSPRKQAAGRAKTGKQQRKVMKPPPDTGSKKAGRAQQLQKLLVKINFQKPGDIRDMSEEDSSDDYDEVSDDDFDPGTTEEAGPDVSDASVTPSPPSSKKVRRHSSPNV